MRRRDTKKTDKHDFGTEGISAVGQTTDGNYSSFPEIPEESVKVLKSHGYEYLFPIQQHCFYPVYSREDLIARDLTGSGKTVAFGLPTIEYLRKKNLFGTGKVQAIILAPTRELALQITAELSKLKHHHDEFKIVTVYGGVSIEN
jgi:ATP-dependent RNA helicase DDX21